MAETTRLSRLEGQLAEVPLLALKAQLQPHFLFNALNTVSVLMREYADAADDMLVGLSALLRKTLDSSAKHEVPLREERPVLVLDELAADQDPEFRAFLYETLLPELRAEGKTIVAVTHDDRWFSAADEVWKMEYGQLRRMHQG